tara:strand:- start:390 stop:893 length:504 start_codon:yes stop_codon:yes gene_type:complete
MKKQELIKIIELVVRKEVKKQMNEIFIKDNDSSSLSELVSENIESKPVQQVKVQQPKKEVKYTSNDALNKVLNETVGGVPQREGGFETMGGGIYDSSKINDILVRESGYGNPETLKEKKREIAAVDTIKKAGVNVDQVPDHVQNALTKDYSKVMKAIDQKKNGGYRP